MSKAVLISIRPEWTRLILSGEKTIEVRKTRPKLETPFKCYIYCTKDPSCVATGFKALDGKWHFSNGHVVGEFVCDEIKTIDIPYPAYWTERHKRELDGSCLTLQQAHSYLGSACGYGWHISELKIYDKPRKLSDFKRHDPTYDFSVFGEVCRTYSIQRPPQSFCYVEELT